MWRECWETRNVGFAGDPPYRVRAGSPRLGALAGPGREIRPAGKVSYRIPPSAPGPESMPEAAVLPAAVPIGRPRVGQGFLADPPVYRSDHVSLRVVRNP